MHKLEPQPVCRLQTMPPTHRRRRASAADTGTMQGSPTAGALISCSATSGRSLRGGACKGRAKGTGSVLRLALTCNAALIHAQMLFGCQLDVGKNSSSSATHLGQVVEAQAGLQLALVHALSAAQHRHRVGGAHAGDDAHQRRQRACSGWGE